MKKTIALLVAGAVGLVVLAKTTNVSSYVSTFCKQARTAAKQSVPTRFEIDRIRNDIAGLDQKLDEMIRPIAEHKVAVDRLRNDVTVGEAKLADQKKVLLDATAAVKQAKKSDRLVYGGKPYTVEQVKTKIAIDFDAYKRLETNLAARRKLLEAKEATLTAAQEQLQRFMSEKEEFKIQLARLEAEHAVNEVAAVGTDVKIDNTPLANIAQALRELKDTIDTQRTALEMKQGALAANGIPLNQPQTATAVDLDAIRSHLEGTTEPKTTPVSTR